MKLATLKRTLHALIQRRHEYPLGKDLKGKVVLITGASRGIGFDITQLLYTRGASLICVGKSEENLWQAFRAFEQERVLCVAGDVANERDVQRIVKKAIERFGRLDVLINNAGIFRGGMLERTSVKDFSESIETNLRGLFLMTRAVLPQMKAAKTGTIITIGSKISRNSKPEPGRVIYAATKYAVEGFTKALSEEVKNDGIRVMCLMPATVNTYLSSEAVDYLSPQKIAEIIYMTLLFEDVNFESLVVKSIHQDI